MVLKIIVKPLAELDLQEAVNWYFLENEELAETFLFEFRDAVRAVSRSPLGFQKRFKSVRAFAMKRFPYHVYYLLDKDTLYIIAVIHQKRNPKLWKRRK
ncbi:MAG: type II toxin-antitoxin system RelE/ParE family toxin [Bacteroidia bacterium]